MNTPIAEIVDLREYPQALDEVVDWHHAEWLRHVDLGSLTKDDIADTLAQRRRAMLQHLIPAAVPSTFLAIVSGRPVGSVSLIYYPLSVEPNRVWLTNLFVIPLYRKLGFGQRLLAFAEAYTAELGIGDVYLYTFDAREFYQQRGWVYQNSSRLRNYKIDILRRLLVH